MSHSSLSLAEAERLEVLIEEASEVIHAATKILRHGKESFNPDLPKELQVTNQEHLTKELDDLTAIMLLRMVAGDSCRKDGEPAHMGQVLARKQKYMHHQPESLFKAFT